MDTDKLFLSLANYVDDRLAQKGNPAVESPAISEFLVLTKSLMRAKGRLSLAADLASEFPNAPRALRILKTAVGAGTLSTNADDYGQLIAAFLESLRAVSAFDNMLNDGMRNAPLHTRIATVTVGLTGDVPSEGVGTRLGSMTLAGDTLAALKASVLLVASNDLVSAKGVSKFLLIELQRAVSAATNTKFVSILEAGASTHASAGATAVNVLTDVQTLLADIHVGDTSRLFLLAPARICARLATKATTTGSLAFPDMRPTGGAIAGITVLACDALTDNSNGAHVVLADADAIVAGSETLAIDSSNAAAIQMADPSTQTSVTPTASAVTSMFQDNSVCLRATRWFGVEKARTNCVSVLTGVAW